jgi:hypothetical protein
MTSPDPAPAQLPLALAQAPPWRSREQPRLCLAAWRSALRGCKARSSVETLSTSGRRASWVTRMFDSRPVAVLFRADPTPAPRL